MRRFLIILSWTTVFIITTVWIDRFFFFSKVVDSWKMVENFSSLEKIHKKKVVPNVLLHDFYWPPVNVSACTKKGHNHFWYELRLKSDPTKHIWVGNYQKSFPELVNPLSFCVGAHHDKRCKKGYKSFSTKLEENMVITIITNVDILHSMRVLQSLRVKDN